jgi:hypothetical protein
MSQLSFVVEGEVLIRKLNLVKCLTFLKCRHHVISCEMRCVREAENYIVLRRKLKGVVRRNRYKFTIIKLHTTALNISLEK